MQQGPALRKALVWRLVASCDKIIERTGRLAGVAPDIMRPQTAGYLHGAAASMTVRLQRLVECFARLLSNAAAAAASKHIPLLLVKVVGKLICQEGMPVPGRPSSAPHARAPRFVPRLGFPPGRLFMHQHHKRSRGASTSCCGRDIALHACLAEVCRCSTQSCRHLHVLHKPKQALVVAGRWMHLKKNFVMNLQSGTKL